MMRHEATVATARDVPRALRREANHCTSAGPHAAALRSATAPSQLDECLSAAGAARHTNACCRRAPAR